MFGLNPETIAQFAESTTRIAEALEGINEQLMLLNLRTGRMTDVIPGPGERRIKT